MPNVDDMNYAIETRVPGKADGYEVPDIEAAFSEMDRFIEANCDAHLADRPNLTGSFEIRDKMIIWQYGRHVFQASGPGLRRYWHEYFEEDYR